MFTKIFAYISSYSILVPTILGIFFFRKLEKELKILSIYLIVMSLVQFGMSTLADLDINNHFLVHFFVPIEFALLAWIYHVHLKDYYPSRLVPMLISVFSLFALMNVLFIQGTEKSNTIPRTIAAFVLILLAISFFYKVLQELKAENLYQSGMFWVSVGIIIYCSGCFYYFVMTNILLVKYPDWATIVWRIHDFFNIILHLCFAVAIWYGREQQQSP